MDFLYPAYIYHYHSQYLFSRCLCLVEDKLLHSPLTLKIRLLISLYIRYKNLVLYRDNYLCLITLGIFITCLLDNIWIFWGEVAY